MCSPRLRGTLDESPNLVRREFSEDGQLILLEMDTVGVTVSNGCTDLQSLHIPLCSDRLIFLGEQLGLEAWIGFGLIAVGLAITDGRLVDRLRKLLGYRT